MILLLAMMFVTLMFGQASSVESAWNLASKGERKEAVRVLRELLKNTPDNVDARLLLGSLLTEEKDSPGAIAQLTEAVRLRPRSAEAHNALAEAYVASGDAKMARGEFERTLAVDPGFAPAHVSLGQILLEAREFPQAAQHLDRAIQLLGNSADAADAHYLRAKINSAQNQSPQAAEHLTAAVKLRPDFAEAWSDLGQARKALNDGPGALDAFKRAVEAAPNDANAQYRLGAEYLHQKESHLAVLHLQKALKINPDDQSALYTVQIALRQDGQPDAARQAKEKLTDLLRRRDEAAEKDLAGVQLNNQGVAFEKAGNLPSALEKYREALTLSPSHIGFRINYAAALLHLGHINEGIAELREAVRRDPGNTQAKAALDKALAKPGLRR